MTTLAHPYSFTAGTTITASEVNANYQATRTTVNGGLDGDNLTSTTAGYVGLSQAGSARRGKCIIATEETRSNVAYATLTTPDQVASIVLPTDGLLRVVYHALWKGTVNGRSAIFLNGVQLSADSVTGGAPSVQEASSAGGGTPRYGGLSSSGLGLVGSNNTTADCTSVTTGQVVTSQLAAQGGTCLIYAAAGTYTVTVQFKSTDATLVSVKERKLWVEAIGF